MSDYFSIQRIKCTGTAVISKYYHQETTKHSLNTHCMEESHVSHSSYGYAVSALVIKISFI